MPESERTTGGPLSPTTDPREAKTFQNLIKAEDKAVRELMDRGLEPRDAVRIVASVSQAAWRRGFQVRSDPMTPENKEEDGS